MILGTHQSAGTGKRAVGGVLAIEHGPKQRAAATTATKAFVITPPYCLMEIIRM